MFNRLIKLFVSFLKIGVFTFGGGFAMIPLIEKEIVEERKWIHREDIIDLFAISQSIPGAVAINTATLVGYKVAGRIGAIIATLGVALPSIVIISLIAIFFREIADLEVVAWIFTGINAAVILLIFHASIRMGKVAVKDITTTIIFCVTVVVVIFTDISPIILIVLGGLIGAGLYYMEKGKRV